MWVLQHHSEFAFDISTIKSFGIWGGSSKRNQFSSASVTILVVYTRGCLLGSDLARWPPNQILSVHWNTTWQTTLEDPPGNTSGLGCHWEHTGWCLHPVVSQWRSSVNFQIWNALEDHWSHKYTGMPLESHWLMQTPSCGPMAIQCEFA